MVWYPTPDDIIEINKLALEESKDKHPHRLRATRQGLQSLIGHVRKDELFGLTYQAARFMKDILTYHAFDNANHRTAYNTAYIFLKKNGVKVRKVGLEVAEPFVRRLPEKPVQEVQAWILEYMVEN